MAKTSKLKTAHKPSLHSRANRRAASPSPLDKTTISTTSYNPSKPSFLAANPNSGIQKSKKAKPLKRNQRLRIEKGRERAENVLGQRETKVAGSEKKVQGKKGRRAGWGELNEGVFRALGEVKGNGLETGGTVPKKKKTKKNDVGKGAKRPQEQGEGEDGWVDEDEEEVAMDHGNDEEGEEVRAPMPGDAIEGEALPTMVSRQSDAAGKEDLEEIS